MPERGEADSEVLRDYYALHGIDPGSQLAKTLKTQGQFLSSRTAGEMSGEDSSGVNSISDHRRRPVFAPGYGGHSSGFICFRLSNSPPST